MVQHRAAAGAWTGGGARVGAGAPGLRVPGGAAPRSRPRVQKPSGSSPYAQSRRDVKRSPRVCAAFK